MHLKIQELKRIYKEKINIRLLSREQLKLDIIILTKTKKKSSWLEMIAGFVFIMECLKRSEQRVEFL